MGDDLKVFGNPYILVDGKKQYIQPFTYKLETDGSLPSHASDYYNPWDGAIIPELPFMFRCYVHPISSFDLRRYMLKCNKYIAYRKAKTLARRKNSTRRKRNARRKASGK